MLAKAGESQFDDSDKSNEESPNQRNHVGKPVFDVETISLQHIREIVSYQKTTASWKVNHKSAAEQQNRRFIYEGWLELDRFNVSY